MKTHQNKVYHLGIKQAISHSTITRANESRDWRIYADYAKHLIGIVRPLYAADKEFSEDLDNTVYALDSTTIDLCLSIFPWARFRKYKAAVKLHTLLDLRGNIPVFVDITDGKVHMDKTVSENKSILGLFAKCGQNPSLDCHLHLLVNCICKKETE